MSARKAYNLIKQWFTKGFLFFLPLIILICFIYIYVMPLMEKTIMDENDLYMTHLQDMINEQFTKVDQIKENMLQKRIVKSLFYVNSTQLYDTNSNIVDLLEFVNELNNINEISSITSTIGIYNKQNDMVYYTGGYNKNDWFFTQAYIIDNKSSGYWTKYFDNTQMRDGVRLLGPYECRNYQSVYKGFYDTEAFIYVAPLNIGSECQLVFFALIDLEQLDYLVSMMQGSENRRTYLYHQQRIINLNEDDDFQPFGLDRIPSEGTVKLGDYIVTSSSKTWWDQPVNIVVYTDTKAAFKDFYTMKKYMSLLILIVAIYTCAFVIILLKKQSEIDRRRESEQIINALMRACYHWKDEHDMERLSQFHDGVYLLAVTAKLNVMEGIGYEDSNKLVIFTCEMNTIITVCSDDEEKASGYLSGYIEKMQIGHIGVAGPCGVHDIHKGFSQALDAYDTSKFSAKETVPVTLNDDGNEFDHYMLEYINMHFDDPNLSLKDIAEHFNINASNVSRQFQHTTGEHFRSYLMGLRIKKACSLLLETDESVNTIGKMAGYENPASFRRIFKQMMGLSPSDYRNNRDAQ